MADNLQDPVFDDGPGILTELMRNADAVCADPLAEARREGAAAERADADDLRKRLRATSDACNEARNKLADIANLASPAILRRFAAQLAFEDMADESGNMYALADLLEGS